MEDKRQHLKRYVKLIPAPPCGGCQRQLEQSWEVLVREEWVEGDVYHQPLPTVIKGLSKLAAEMVYSREILNGAMVEWR